MTLLCSVHKDVAEWELPEIRKSVCAGTVQGFHRDKKPYCLLHRPTKDKNVEEFSEIVAKRIGIARAEKIHTSPSPAETVGQLDLRYVWFPDEPLFFTDQTLPFDLNLKGATFSEGVRFRNTKFWGEVNLIRAEFSRAVDFYKATFQNSSYFSQSAFDGVADFQGVTFNGPALFYSVEFKEQAQFRYCTFWGNSHFDYSKFRQQCSFTGATFDGRKREEGDPDITANFKEVEFHMPAEFENAKFKVAASFKKAQFLSESTFRWAKFFNAAEFKEVLFQKHVYFSHAEFSEKTEVSFYHARFEKDAYFHVTSLMGGASFNSAVFAGDSDVIFRQGCIRKKISFRYASVEGLLRFREVKNELCDLMDFQEVSTENATRVSFNSVKLRPSWFVNADSRAFVFTNVEWGIEGRAYRTVCRELDSIAERNIPRDVSYELLSIALRHLASNAENANSLAHASRFRLLAFECERLERKADQRRWWSELKALFYGEVECGSFFRRAGQLVKNLKDKIISAPYDPVHFLYRGASSFGEKWINGAIGLVLIWFVFGVIYYVLRGWIQPEWTFWQALGFSTSTMLLQKWEGQITSHIIFTLRTLQMISAPIQAAVLALAIRRKFMR